MSQMQRIKSSKCIIIDTKGTRKYGLRSKPVVIALLNAIRAKMIENVPYRKISEFR